MGALSGPADARLDAALQAALAQGPADVLALLERLRATASPLLTGNEGLVHAALHRLVRAAQVRVAEVSPRGLPAYAWNGHGTPPLSGDWGPRASAHDAVAVGVSRAVREATGRVRVLVDVAAHREDLLARGRADDFGSPRHVHALLKRVDRGQRTVLVAPDAGAHVRRFLVHEGPWILGALALFLTVKLFFADVFVIPSPSMVPTLALGDRVVVVKRGRGWRPERWQVVTFRHQGPDGPDTVFVKRVVGLPGEDLAIWRGDLYRDGQILVKPDALAAMLRRPVKAWDLSRGAPASGWRVTSSAAGVEVWQPATDPFASGLRSDGPVLDVYLALEADLTGQGEVALTLERTGEGGTDGVTFHLAAGPQGVRLTEVRPGASPGVLPQSSVLLEDRSPRGGRTRLALDVRDGEIHAQVGESVWRGARDLPVGGVRFSFTLRGAGVRPMAFALDQDLHYGAEGTFAAGAGSARPEGNRHRVPDDSLFMLGDNTANSRDSRFPDMGDISLSRLVGPVVFRIWPVSRIGGVD